MYLEEPYFPDYWRVSLVIPVFQNIGKICTDKNCLPVNLLSVDSKVFEKLLNNGLVHQTKEISHFF